jgi:predicted RNA binding protein YcfA (HicA-like mRNA interferase family)
MSNGIMNWTFADIESFLKENNFSLNHVRGSHYYYVGYQNKKMCQVCVPRHGNVALKPRTMKGIILQSGIDKKVWLGK